LPLRGKATKAINIDSAAIFLGDVANGSYFSDVPRVSADDFGVDTSPDNGNPSSDAVSSEKAPAVKVQKAPVVDLRGALDGYRITSLASHRAIVAGPGGSRVVFDGEEAVIGGVLWNVRVRSSAVQFGASEQKVLLLFDKSLSSFNADGGQSSDGNNTSSNDDQ
jgi:hypothetical protein